MKIELPLTHQKFIINNKPTLSFGFGPLKKQKFLMKISNLNLSNLLYVILFAVTVSFISCKGGSGGLDLSGEWKAKVELSDDMSEEDKAMAQAMLSNFQLNFKDGGKVDFTMMGMSEEGTYSHNKEKNVVEITIQGDTQEFKINGNNLEADMEGTKLVFTKS